MLKDSTITGEYKKAFQAVSSVSQQETYTKYTETFPSCFSHIKSLSNFCSTLSQSCCESQPIHREFFFSRIFLLLFHLQHFYSPIKKKSALNHFSSEVFIYSNERVSYSGLQYDHVCILIKPFILHEIMSNFLSWKIFLLKLETVFRGFLKGST